jgi:hypothetical protein
LQREAGRIVGACEKFHKQKDGKKFVDLRVMSAIRRGRMGHQPWKRIWLVLRAGGRGCNGKIANHSENRGISGKSGREGGWQFRENPGAKRDGYAIGAAFPDF